MGVSSRYRVEGLTSSVAIKAPVKAVSTANLTLSGLQTVGGVALAAGDRVLVKDQSTATDNGIYEASTGSWSRAADFDGSRDVVAGTLVMTDGVASSTIFYRCSTPDPITIGTSSITFAQASELQNPYPRSAAEIAASVVPTDFGLPYGWVTRFGAVGDNSTDSTTPINNAFAAAKNAAAGAGCKVFLPRGKYKTTGPLNLTGLFFANNVSIEGEGPWASQIVAAFNGGNVLDLSGSVLVKLSNFGIVPSGSFKTDQVILCARLASNNSAGNHSFHNLYVEGNCNNAVAVLWGSEENQFHNCWITSSAGTASRDFPALVMAVKISEAGFTPTSSFQTLGTGSGGVGMNSFYGCRITNECGTVQTKPLMRLYGTLGTNFHNCYFASWPGASGHTIDINGSTYPDDPASVYPSTVTFDTCSDENAWGDQSTQRTLYFGATPVGGQYNVRGVSVHNCQFFRVYGADGSLVDGFRYAGGKFSNSLASPTGSKFSFYNLYNANIDVAKHERALTCTVRNIGEANFYRGFAAGSVAKGTDTTSVIMDANGGITATGGLLNLSPSVPIGYEAGAGGTVTQITSASTGVTLNRPVGQITTVALTTAAGAEEEFTLTNSTITINDVIACSTTYAGAGTPAVTVKGVANGSCRIVITNLHAANALNAALTLNFAVIRGITS